MCKNGGQKQNIRKLKIGTKTAHGKMNVTKYCRYRAILLPFPALSLSLISLLQEDEGGTAEVPGAESGGDSLHHEEGEGAGEEEVNGGGSHRGGGVEGE